MSKTEFQSPDILHPSRLRSVSLTAAPKQKQPAAVLSRHLSVLERRKMFEQESRKGGDKDMLLPPSSGQEQTDHPLEKFAGKRRHTTKERFSGRGSSFRSKKLRQEMTSSELGNGSPPTRHKQQASVTSINLPPLWSRLRNFGHHDLQSATMERFGSGKPSSRTDRCRRRPTGASAAHCGVAVEEAALETLHNDLLAACPAFRNEIGGDADWAGSQLTRSSGNNSEGAHLLLSLRDSLSHDKHKRVGSRAKMILEGSIPSKDIMEHKTPMDRQVLQILHPQSSVQFPFEFIDFGALYYRNHFYQHDHQNFFGMDENNGPLAISLRRERVAEDLSTYFDTTSTVTSLQATPPKHQYRVIVRTSELETLRGTILEDSIPSGTKTGTSKGLPPRDVIDYISQGEFHVGCLKVGKQEKKVYQELMRLDEQELNNKYKIGVLYCKKGQCNEEDMYNNEAGSKAFEEFLRTIGDKVTLKGFTKYRAQLDNKTDTTGAHSIYTEHQGTEMMFHISTYLPHTPSNRQQLLRKRHIGNDIVTVIFQEPGCTPFSPKVIRSHFQHIFVIVRVENPGTDYTKYRVAVTRSEDIPYFGPSIPEGGVFDKNEQFKEFFLTKLINACNASLRSAKFANMATRTRRQYLSDLCESSCTNMTIESANASGLVGLLSKNWGGKKREKPQLQSSLVFTPGALVWNVAIVMKEGKPLSFYEEYDASIECTLVMAADLMAFVYTNTRDNVLHIPMKDIAGWIQDGKRLNLFYDGSHCLSLEVYEQDDVRDITCRLLALGPCLSASHEATLMEFQRGPNGLLGFLINEAGEVHRVTGQAKQIGLQMKSRILQVEDRLVCTHKHSQITEILTDRSKTTVMAYVIPPVPTTHRALMYYPSLNWSEIWSTRPSHMNGDTEEQTQNGPEPMDTSEPGSGAGGGGSVALRVRKKAATIHSSRPNRTSYHEALRMDEVGQLDELQQDDEEPIYDRLRITENQPSQANVSRVPPPRARSPKPKDNMGYTRVRSRGPGGRDHMPAQQIAENIRATERARSAGPSPEPLEHKLDIYTSHVPTHISTSSFLPNSQPHTTAPLSSLRRKGSDKVLIEILDPKSPSSSGDYPATPGSVQELTKKFSFNSPPQSNKSSPSRAPGSSLVGGAKSQTTPMKATVSTSEMTRSGIPTSSRPSGKFSPSPESGEVQMRSKLRSPKIRPASWDVSLIYDGESGGGDKRPLPHSGLAREEHNMTTKQFSRKENGRLPVRKRGPSPEDGKKGEEGGEESEEPIAAGENLSQEELKRRISVRERTQHWEARGSDLPSFFTLPKSFRSKGGNGGVTQPPGSRIPAPRSSSSPHTALTQSLKARNVYSKQSTPPIQEETDGHDDEKNGESGGNRLSDKGAAMEMERESTSPPRGVGSEEVKLGSFVGGKVGVVSQMRGNIGSGNRSSIHSNSQVLGQREMSPVRATSPTRRFTVSSTRSPSPNSGSKIPTSSVRRAPSDVPLRRKPSPGVRNSRAPRVHSLDAVVLESGFQSLQLSPNNERFPNKDSTNRKVEDWLRQSSVVTVAEDTVSSLGKQESIMRERRDQYRKNIHTRSMVKTAMI